MARRVESNQSYVGGCAGVDAYVDADADAFLSSCMKQAPIEPVGRGPAIGYSLHAANIQGLYEQKTYTLGKAKNHKISGNKFSRFLPIFEKKIRVTFTII